MPDVLNGVCTIYTPKFHVWRRAVQTIWLFWTRYVFRPCLSWGMSMLFQTGYYFRKGMVVQQDFEKGRSHRLWFVKKLAIFFRVSRWGRRGGGFVRCTLRYMISKAANSFYDTLDLSWRHQLTVMGVIIISWILHFLLTAWRWKCHPNDAMK